MNAISRAASGSLLRQQYLKVKQMRTTAAVLAGLWLLPVPAPGAAEQSGVVGVFRELITPEMLRTVRALERDLSKAGFVTKGLSGADLVNGISCDALIYAAGKRYPAGSEKSLLEYLRRGGKLIVLGAPAFSEPMWRIQGAWRTWDQIRADLNASNASRVVFSFDRPAESQGWSRSTNAQDAPGKVSAGDYGGGSGRSLQVDIGNLTGWDNWNHEVSGLPAGRQLITFRARGEARTGQIMIELAERDGSRWIAATPVTTTWAKYALSPSDFKHWADGSARGRGGAGDSVRLPEVRRIAIGLAFSHTPVAAGSHRFWIDEIAAHADPRAAAGQSTELIVDGLAPGYKYFPVRGAIQARAAPGQVFTSGAFPLPRQIASVSPRPQGTGFRKARRQRFVPLIQAYDSENRRAGYAAWMHINGPPDFAGSAWAVFGVNEPSFYAHPKTRNAIVGLTRALLEQPVFYEAGAEFYAYFPEDRDIRFGARVLTPDVTGYTPSVRMTIVPRGHPDPTGEIRLPMTPAPAESWPGARASTFEATWSPGPGDWSRGPFLVRAELLRGNRLLDRVEHEMAAWTPKPEAERAYVSARDGAFQLRGKRWAPHGVNYMPSYGIATEDNEAFERWLDGRAYDPAVVDEDLARIKALGMNSISVFIYHRSLAARNLLDLLMRAERHGLKVNLSLRPHADPFDFRWEEVKDLITFHRLRENDTVFAYDLAWERGFGHYEPSYYNAKGRKGYDAEWKQWIIERYGSLESAERDWKTAVPRKDGEVTSPSDEQLDRDGPWRIMIAAYRRFVDDLSSRAYGRAARMIREIDPNHPISYRMTLSGDPTSPPREMPFDFRGLGRALDIMEPEGYGRVGDWSQVRAGAFTAAYSRYAAPGRPVYWAEFGRHMWSGSNFLDPNPAAAAQAAFYDDFYRMMALSGANGSSCWWFPGGFRKNENSDYGILNPDGSPRPVTAVIRRRIPEVSRIGEESPPPVDNWIEVDRDADARGLFGIYEKVKGEFWKAIESGRRPGLRDGGTGTTSVNTPMLALGNTPYNGANPPKYLNSEFDRLEVRDASGRWIDVSGGLIKRGISVVEVAAGAPVVIRAEVGNTGPAAWTAPTAAAVKGAVYLATRPESDAQFTAPVPIPADTPHLGTIRIAESVIFSASNREAVVVVQFTALDRMWFGEKIAFRLRPRAANEPLERSR